MGCDDSFAVPKRPIEELYPGRDKLVYDLASRLEHLFDYDHQRIQVADAIAKYVDARLASLESRIDHVEGFNRPIGCGL